MAYVSFISDHDLLQGIDRLYKVYQKSFAEKTLNQLNKNIIDPFKLQFDSAFLYDGDLMQTINNEVYRQSDKTISNAIGDFHQYLIGCINGFTETPELPCDIKKKDNTIFAEVKNKHNTMNVRSMESVFNELRSLAAANPQATCYLIQVIAKRSRNELWTITINQTQLGHPRVRIISADKFYAIATGNNGAFADLVSVLPNAINDYMTTNGCNGNLGLCGNSKAYDELEEMAEKEENDLLGQLFQYSIKSYFE